MFPATARGEIALGSSVMGPISPDWAVSGVATSGPTGLARGSRALPVSGWPTNDERLDRSGFARGDGRPHGILVDGTPDPDSLIPRAEPIA
jgi:hypothetical protein